MTPASDDSAQLHIPENLPAPVSDWLTRVCQALIASFGADLESLILFGSAAEGRMRASSDVNLLVVLHRWDANRLNDIVEVIQTAAAAIELHPLFVLHAELPLAAESFAVKFEDIAHRRVVLHGEDPFRDLVIPRAVLVAHVQQVLLNLILRLRATSVLNRDRDEVLTIAIADAAAPLRRSAQTIMELRGSKGLAPKQALQELTVELGSGWDKELALLSKAREELRLPAGSAAHLLSRMADLAQAMQSAAAALRA
jgi:predicted nucleotidyltransferase